MRIFRLHRGQRLAADYSGSLLYPNRWNPAGTAMLYSSATLSLACLELLVHLPPNLIPAEYVYSTAELEAPPEVADFRGDLKDVDAARRFGHQWAADVRSLALFVPSLVVPIEFNVLLNPVHAGFARIPWSAPERFGFDPRLLRGKSVGS